MKIFINENKKKYVDWLVKSINLSKELNLKIISTIIEINNDFQLTKLVEKWINQFLTGECEPVFTTIRKEPKKFGLLALVAILLASDDTFSKYKEKGISEKIFLDTMSDIRIWTENFYQDYGVWGVEEVNWLSLHLCLKVFRLGRLQFEFSVYHDQNEFEKLEDVTDKIKDGDLVLEVHIPQGDKLLLEACNQSFDQANEFFSKYYPEFNYLGYFCHSWLLSPYFKEVLSNSSNIIKFQNLFTIVYLDIDSEQYKERIFGRNYKEMKEYPCQTTLQKSVIDFIQTKGKMGAGLGIKMR